MSLNSKRDAVCIRLHRTCRSNGAQTTASPHSRKRLFSHAHPLPPHPRYHRCNFRILPPEGSRTGASQQPQPHPDLISIDDDHAGTATAALSSGRAAPRKTSRARRQRDDASGPAPQHTQKPTGTAPATADLIDLSASLGGERVPAVDRAGEVHMSGEEQLTPTAAAMVASEEHTVAAHAGVSDGDSSTQTEGEHVRTTSPDADVSQRAAEALEDVPLGAGGSGAAQANPPPQAAEGEDGDAVRAREREGWDDTAGDVVTPFSKVCALRAAVLGRPPECVVYVRARRLPHLLISSSQCLKWGRCAGEGREGGGGGGMRPTTESLCKSMVYTCECTG